MRWGEGLFRLTIRPVGGQGQPYGDDVVAQARELVETSVKTQKEIGAALGISAMTVGRWARAGGWHRPPGSFRAPGAQGTNPRTRERFETRMGPWRLLAKAEALVAGIDAAAPDLDRLERALGLVLEARTLHAQGFWKKRRRSEQPPSSHVSRASS